MTDSETPGSAPGWYPDQTDPSRQRYFDGATWTDEYALVGGPTPVVGTPRKPPMRRGLKIGLGVGIAVALIAGALALVYRSQIEDLYAQIRGGSAKVIAEKCGEGTYKLLDNNNSISFSINESTSEEQFNFIRCVVEQAGIPSSVKFRLTNMGAAGWSAGAQEEEWDGWKMLFAYDRKDDQLNILLSKV